MERISLPIISAYLILLLGLSLTLTAADLNNKISEISRTAKSFNPSVYGSQDYENEFYNAGQPSQTADDRFYSLLLNDVSEVRRQLTETESAILAAIPGLAALFGVVGVAYVQQNEFNILRNQINDLSNRIGQTEQEQSSICTSAKQFGGYTCSFGDSSAPTDAETVACFNTLVGYSSPTCS